MFSHDKAFWAKVDVRGPDECWEWRGDRSEANYGNVYRRIDGRKRRLRAHRIAFELSKGPIPSGKFICHTCDNPPCCNPAHLWAGSHADNTADCARKKRMWLQKHPEQCPLRKLSDEQVLAVRFRFNLCGDRQKDIAREFGITQAHVSSLASSRFRPL